MASRLAFRLVWLACMPLLLSFASQWRKPFNCTGGSIYFTAHPVDGLLYQNPDIMHELYVFKCVTAVVMTSGDRGMGSNSSISLERGLQEAYTTMAAVSVDDPTKEETTIRIGTHNVHSWSLRGVPNIQIIFLRLPDGAPNGDGYDTNHGMSLSKLYHNKIDSISTTDGKATYTMRDLKELIAFILHVRKPNDVRILNHKAKLPDGKRRHEHSDHTDHIVSAKLVQSAITRERIEVTVKSYAGNIARKLDANIKPNDSNFAKKIAAFLKYAVYDDSMCQSHEECLENLMNDVAEDDVRYVSEYMQREYIVL